MPFEDLPDHRARRTGASAGRTPTGAAHRGGSGSRRRVGSATSTRTGTAATAESGSNALRPASRQAAIRRRMAVGGIAVVVVLGIVLATSYLYGLYRYQGIKKQRVAGLVPATVSSENILLVGNSCRTCLNGKQAAAFGTAAQAGSGGGSDVVMVLHLNPAKHTASIISIPRDTFLPIAGTKTLNRINTSFTLGPSALVHTVEQDFGIPISHYVSLNFDTFQTVVNQLGGLNMYFPNPVKDQYSGLNVPTAGCHHLNGFQALSVVRARHLYYFANGQWNYDGMGDLSRIKRDHEFLRVLAATVKAKGVNPLKINSVLTAIVPDLKVDSKLSYNHILGLGLAFSSINPAQIPSNTLPVYVDNQSLYFNNYDQGQVVYPEQPQDAKLFNSVLGTHAPSLPKGVTVQVLNGSGIYHQAADVASQLQSLGMSVTGTGNGPNTASFAETVIYYSPGHLNDAKALQAKLTGNVVMGEAKLPKGTDLQVVTGNLLSVNTPTSASGGAPQPPSFASNLAVNSTPPHSALAPWDPTACPSGSQVTPIGG